MLAVIAVKAVGGSGTEAAVVEIAKSEVKVLEPAMLVAASLNLYVVLDLKPSKE